MRVPHTLNLSLTLAATATAVETLVDLGYAKYQGMTLGNGVNQWLGMRYAAPSVPPLRFSAAQAPLPEADVQDATKQGSLCLSANNQEGLQFGSPRQPMAEDCLFAAVYAPANATQDSNLPIMMFVSGGGFSSNSNGNFNGTGLVAASAMNMIVVQPNYRVGILGFVGGTMVDADTKGAVSNNGLKDLVFAARWIKQHATKFGGNPNHIVVSGASSGGNAIDILLAANGGVGFPDLFVGAIAESTGWGSDGFTVNRDSALTKNINATGCSNNPDPIDCMRMMPIADLQSKLTKDGWGPTIDGNFLTAPHYQLYEQGRFQNIPVIYGYTSDEATPGFISNQTVNTTDELANDFRNDIGKSMTDAEVEAVLAAYPESLNKVSFFGRDMGVRDPALRQGKGAQWQRDAAILTELQQHCVGAFFSDMFASVGQVQTYAYRYNILDETAGGNADKGLFSPHTSELYAVWGRNHTDGGDPGCLSLAAGDRQSCAGGAAVAQAYWISFVRALDPNVYRASDTPEWTSWAVADPNRLVIDNGAAAMEKMGGAVGEVPLAGMNQRQRCLSLTLPLSKRINVGLGEGGTLPPFANGTREDPTLAVMSNSVVGGGECDAPSAAQNDQQRAYGAAANASAAGTTTVVTVDTPGGGSPLGKAGSPYCSPKPSAPPPVANLTGDNGSNNRGGGSGGRVGAVGATAPSNFTTAPPTNATRTPVTVSGAPPILVVTGAPWNLKFLLAAVVGTLAWNL